MVYAYPPSALRIPITRRVPISKIFPTARYRITANAHLPTQPSSEVGQREWERAYLRSVVHASTLVVANP
jgi:hypothetical protein